jgi:hypothetical protein
VFVQEVSTKEAERVPIDGIILRVKAIQINNYFMGITI